MKFRFLIERADTDDGEQFYLTTITRDDTGGHGPQVASGEAAKAMAESTPYIEDDIVWKEPPKEWQPVAILMSQWLDDGVGENSNE